MGGSSELPQLASPLGVGSSVSARECECVLCAPGLVRWEQWRGQPLLPAPCPGAEEDKRSITLPTGRDRKVDVHAHRPWRDAPPWALARARTLSWTNPWTQSRTWTIPRFRPQSDGAKSWASECVTSYADDGVC